jgi:choline dehydrogenase
MGSDSDDVAVVDAEPVSGELQARVVDASVMPDLPGGNINAPAAEKAADLMTSAHPADKPSLNSLFQGI